MSSFLLNNQTKYNAPGSKKIVHLFIKATGTTFHNFFFDWLLTKLSPKIEHDTSGSFFYWTTYFWKNCVESQKSSCNILFGKSVEVHFNRSKVFLLYFYDAYYVNLWEKNFGRSTGYSCRTNVFTEFHHFMKKIYTAED